MNFNSYGKNVHNVGCGQDVPGVYMNVSNYLNWIQSTTSIQL